jgi:DNA-binding NarL/FixJ family response regulator
VWGVNSSFWVYSPHAVLGEALAAYVTSIGFRVQSVPERAMAAVFDLTAFESPLPPPPPMPCLAMIRSPDPELVEAVLRIGYHGTHHPSYDCARFTHSLHDLLAAAERARTVEAPAPEPDAASLTTRETQVLGLLMLGLPNKRIAARLDISERTAKHHVSSLLRKHVVRSRLSLLAKVHAMQRADGDDG